MSEMIKIAQKLAEEGPATLNTIQDANEAAEETLRTHRGEKPLNPGQFGPKLEKAIKILTPEEAAAIADFNAAISEIDKGVQGLSVKLNTGIIPMEDWWQSTKNYMNQGKWVDAADNIHGMLTAVPDFRAKGYNTKPFALSLQHVLKAISN
ncbi:hypothetical protein J7337_007819 [Fusarium musae]|uniref:Uncharacterized protein n=1 Tax=Fusarium musae TaxID=1042133 RepID=A0A9P8IR31_9HYPO|nr:hypothetical protein J7337_007819 [Fusarium musae]KAG9502103.1 hypothetical protein J7337_007819 [Fusarium musae]